MMLAVCQIPLLTPLRKDASPWKRHKKWLIEGGVSKDAMHLTKITVFALEKGAGEAWSRQPHGFNFETDISINGVSSTSVILDNASSEEDFVNWEINSL